MLCHLSQTRIQVRSDISCRQLLVSLEFLALDCCQQVPPVEQILLSFFAHGAS